MQLNDKNVNKSTNEKCERGLMHCQKLFHNITGGNQNIFQEIAHLAIMWPSLQ